LKIPFVEPGTVGPCPVAPDALQGIVRQQTNAARWNGAGWREPSSPNCARQASSLPKARRRRGIFATDAGGTAYGLPHGVLVARSAAQVAALLKAAQAHRVPVTVRGGGLTTEGESVAYGGVLLDMTGMSRVLAIDARSADRAHRGRHLLARPGRGTAPRGLDYLSAPLNMTSSVGGTLGVGGIDVNSARLGCSADQALALQVVTPTGEIVECSDSENAELFQRVILGYGQFGVITEATLKIRPYTPLSMHYYYYSTLREAIEDLQMLDANDASDYSGILTIMDCAVNLLVAFDSSEREAAFKATWESACAATANSASPCACRPLRHAAVEARRGAVPAEAQAGRVPRIPPPEFHRDGRMEDRTVVFSRAVWKHWGSRNMVIPDLATSADKFIEAVERGNAVCRKFFPHYTLYCVGIKLRRSTSRTTRCPACRPDAAGWAYGCEFEPMIEDAVYSRDHFQSFKNAIYDIGVDLGASYYRFGGMMKGYIRRVFGDALVDRHLAMKRRADPAMILNRDVIF
jgi:hypothetical protein